MPEQPSQPAVMVQQPQGPVEVKTATAASFLDGWPSLAKLFLQLGFAGVFIYIFMEDRYYARQDAQSESQLSRETHREAFKQMREDLKSSNEHDRAQRSKTNASIREGNATLKEIQTEARVGQKIMLDQQTETKRLVGAVESLIKKMPEK